MSIRSYAKQDGNDINDDDPEAEEYAIIPPNGGWGWIVVISAFYCNVVVDGIQLTFGIFLNEIASEFNAKASVISLVGSLMFGIHLLMGPICSGLSNVFGIRPTTVTGCIITTVGIALCYFAPNYQFLYVSYGFLGGAGLGFIYMNSLLITSMYFTSRRVLAVSIVVCGTGCGTVTFALLANYLVKVTTWQISFLIQAAFVGSLVPVALTFIPLKPKRIIVASFHEVLPTNRTVKARISKFSRLSAMSKFSGISKTGSEGASSMYSVKTVVYIRKQTKASIKSLTTNHDAALEKLADRAIIHQILANIQPSRSCPCPCLRRRRREESVIVLDPEETEVLAEDNYEDMKSDTPSWTSENWTIANTPTPAASTYSKHVIKTVGPKQYCDCKPLKETVIMMLNCRLLRSYSFAMFCVSGAVGMSSMLIAFMYEKERSTQHHGFSDDIATYLIITLGAANMFWRLFLGLLSTVFQMNSVLTPIILSIIGSLGSLASTLSPNIYLQFSSTVVFALGMAGFAVFRPILLMELIGAEMAINATGIALLFMGIASIIAPPLAGLLMETTKDYNAVIYTSALLLAVSGLLLIRIKQLREKDLRRLQNMKGLGQQT